MKRVADDPALRALPDKEREAALAVARRIDYAEAVKIVEGAIEHTRQLFLAAVGGSLSRAHDRVNLASHLRTVLHAHQRDGVQHSSSVSVDTDGVFVQVEMRDYADSETTPPNRHYGVAVGGVLYHSARL